MSLQTNTNTPTPNVQLTVHDTALADSGVLFTALTPTPGTGIIGFATATTAALGDTNPYLTLWNSSQAGGSPVTIYPLWMRFTISAVSVAATNEVFEVTTDVGNRVTTAATALTIQNCNNASPNKSQAVINVGANVASAFNANTRRFVDRVVMRTLIGVLGDQYTLQFGGGVNLNNAGILAGTAQVDLVKNFPAISIAPNGYLSINHWSASMSTNETFEVAMAYIEK